MPVTKAKKTGSFSVLQFIRTIYLSAAAIVGLVMFLIGASGGIKLWLTHSIFPSNYNYTYYAPYSQSPCDFKTAPDGKQIAATDQEKQDCQAKLDESNKQQDLANFNGQIADSIALTVVGLPVWLFHFWLIQLDWKRRREI